jgi:NAD(P)-dependent dehydrogenase (short-subunit alcohol dehydrogenase family)
MTVATHVLAPFRLSELVIPLLRPSRSAIVTVSSGGMYTERFDLGLLEMAPSQYRGTIAYARAKRAQVILASQWQRRLGPAVSSYSTDPGWVKTAGLQEALASVARLGPLLRSPDQGADTIVWLLGEALGGPEVPEPGFWHDRRRRGEYYRPGTRPSPLHATNDGEALWDWCITRTRST